MITRTALNFATYILMACALIACTPTQADRPRCAECGMFADTMPRWQTGVTTNEGRALTFDGPKCLVRWLAAHASSARNDAWVIEYYTQARRLARESFFVIGADVRGPMGEELVPISDRANAERFLREHHARRILTWQEVTSTRDLSTLVR